MIGEPAVAIINLYQVSGGEPENLTRSRRAGSRLVIAASRRNHLAARPHRAHRGAAAHTAAPILAPVQASSTPPASDPARFTTADLAPPPRASARQSSAQVEYVVYAPMRPVCVTARSQSGQRFSMSRPYSR